MGVKDSLDLIGVRLRYEVFRFLEEVQVPFRYYKKRSFWKSELGLYRSYLLHSPFAVHRRFLQARRASNIYTYGETPLSTLDFIAKSCELGPQDHVFELGSATGRSSFFLNRVHGCKVTGIEEVPDFVLRAREVQEHCEIPETEVKFIQGDILKQDYSQASLVYLYGSCFGAAFIERLIEKLQSCCEPGCRILSVSYPLNAFLPEGAKAFKELAEWELRFSWGKASVFLQSLR